LVRVEHIRTAGLSPRHVRPLFDRNGLDWTEFLANGVDVCRVAAAGDALSVKLARIALSASLPVQGADGELRVRQHHIRAAKICMKGSRAFFAKHGLSWSDFLDNGLPVRVLEEIGDPVALRAAVQAVAEEAHGR
jgi:hypothetical protein